MDFSLGPLGLETFGEIDINTHLNRRLVKFSFSVWYASKPSSDMMHLSNLCLLALLAVRGLADDIDYGAAAQSISATLADPSFVPYTKPTQKIDEFIALGDSYTAGTGCNGINEVIAGDAVRGQRSYPMQMSQDKDNWAFINNGDETLPRFSFHAYTGDTSQNLVVEQLKQGDYKDDKNLPRGQPFGTPQVAVLTIGGNDAMLST